MRRASLLHPQLFRPGKLEVPLQAIHRVLRYQVPLNVVETVMRLVQAQVREEVSILAQTRRLWTTMSARKNALAIILSNYRINFTVSFIISLDVFIFLCPYLIFIFGVLLDNDHPGSYRFSLAQLMASPRISLSIYIFWPVYMDMTFLRYFSQFTNVFIAFGLQCISLRIYHCSPLTP